MIHLPIISYRMIWTFFVECYKQYCKCNANKLLWRIFHKHRWDVSAFHVTTKYLRFLKVTVEMYYEIFRFYSKLINIVKFLKIHFRRKWCTSHVDCYDVREPIYWCRLAQNQQWTLVIIILKFKRKSKKITHIIS